MACSLCRGPLVPIEVPTAETAFRCMVCGTVDTAEKMMARALRKAIQINYQEEEPREDRDAPATGEQDRQAVEAFLKSLTGT